jgi:hypothetical protein
MNEMSAQKGLHIVCTCEIENPKKIMSSDWDRAALKWATMDPLPTLDSKMHSDINPAKI